MSRRLIMALCVLAGLAAGFPTAQAATFYILNQIPGAAYTVLDPAAVEITGAGVLRASSITVQRSIKSQGPPQPGYLKTLSEYDCATRRTRWISFALYARAGGKLMEQVNPKADWSDPDHNVEAGEALALLCHFSDGSDLRAISAPSIGNLVLALFSTWTDPPPPPPPLAKPPSPPLPLSPKTGTRR